MGTNGQLRPKTILVIGDSHSEPSVPNDRYRWLGKYAADLQPDAIVDIGDWADMASLSKYDYGKRTYEGRRYSLDVEHAKSARKTFNTACKTRGKWKPELIHTEGNHEYRITKLAQEDAKLEGKVSHTDLGVEALGWKRYPFLKPVVINGIAFCHYFPSGNEGRAIGGDNTGAALIRTGLMSSVQGHSHLFDYAERTRFDGVKVLGMSVGCYFQHYLDYAGPVANSKYWQGVVVLHDVVDGFGAVEKVPLDWIEKNYGD